MLCRNCQNPLPWPLCGPQAGLVVPKAPSQGLKLLILTSFSPHLDLSFSILQLIWHYGQCIFDLQSSSHSSINELCCPQLVYQTSEHTVCFNVHHSLFTISDHISHVGSLSLFSKSPLTRVSNTRTYNQGMTKQLSPIDYPINLSPRTSSLRVNRWMHDVLALLGQL